MVDMKTIIELYKKEVNKTIETALIENGIPEEETKEIMDEMMAKLSDFEVTLDIPYAIGVLLQEIYGREDYKEVLKKLEERQGTECTAIELSRTEKRQFTHAMLDFLDHLGLLPLFIRLWCLAACE